MATEEDLGKAKFIKFMGPRDEATCAGPRGRTRVGTGARGGLGEPFSVPGARGSGAVPSCLVLGSWVTKGRGNVGTVCGVDKEVGQGLEARFLKMSKSHRYRKL